MHESDLDLVDLRTSEHVAIERFEEHVAVGHPVSHLIGPGVDHRQRLLQLRFAARRILLEAASDWEIRFSDELLVE